MNTPQTSRKIGVFYDGNFLLHASNYYNYIHVQQRRLSITGLHNFIRDRIALSEQADPCLYTVTQAHYFRGRLNASEASQRGNQLYNDRVFDDILMAEGVHSHYLPLRNLMGRKEERGIDVWLSLEVLHMALRGELDVVVLIVSDTDYTPLFRKLISLGIPVMLLSWEFEYVNDDGMKMITKTSHELLSLATYPIAMHKVIDEGLRVGDPVVESLFVNNDFARGAEENEYEQSEVLCLKSGFGFIKYPNNNLFFHHQDVQGDFNELAVGDMVEFVLDKNAQNQDVAKCVRKLNAEFVTETEQPAVELLVEA